MEIVENQQPAQISQVEEDAARKERAAVVAYVRQLAEGIYKNSGNASLGAAMCAIVHEIADKIDDYDELPSSVS